MSLFLPPRVPAVWSVVDSFCLCFCLSAYLAAVISLWLISLRYPYPQWPTQCIYPVKGKLGVARLCSLGFFAAADRGSTVQYKNRLAGHLKITRGCPGFLRNDDVIKMCTPPHSTQTRPLRLSFPLLIRTPNPIPINNDTSFPVPLPKSRFTEPSRWKPPPSRPLRPLRPSPSRPPR